ncbi:MAG: transporter [Dysgonamonadaceae bacterium]|jgi:BASS family bile acid:Na+ symporter|nr:transporter [Dysgonamonadaceae bacterium]
MQKLLEKYLLPIAMFIGIAFNKPLSVLSWATPYLLFMMLFITYSRISWKDIRLTKFHYILLAIQYVGSALVYLALKPFNEIVAQAAMICVLAPTATSAPVVAGLLGGNIPTVAAYSIMSNLSVAFIAPVFLSAVGHSLPDMSFAASAWYIFQHVVPILILPFVFALILQKISPKAYQKVRSAQIVSFYLWAVALTIVVGKVARFVVEQHEGNFRLEIAVSAAALMICLCQFILGRSIGKRFDRVVAGGQGLGQKNTILAIWLTQTYLNPLASIGPGMYVMWQNVVNSYQIWRKTRNDERKNADNMKIIP